MIKQNFVISARNPLSEDFAVLCNSNVSQFGFEWKDIATLIYHI